MRGNWRSARDLRRWRLAAHWTCEQYASAPRRVNESGPTPDEQCPPCGGPAASRARSVGKRTVRPSSVPVRARSRPPMAAPGQQMLQVDDLTFGYGADRLFEGVAFSLAT